MAQKQINLPPPVTLPAEEGVRKEEARITAPELIRDMVLTLAYWHQGAELERIDAHEELSTALEPLLVDAELLELRVSSDARKHLKIAMSLTNQAGVAIGQINDVNLNRYYMRTLRSVVVAADVKPAEAEAT